MAAHDTRVLESRVDPARVDLPAHAQPLQPLTQRVEWLLSQGGGSARLHLHPPHLGEVQLQVRAVGSDIRISMIAEEAGARVLLEAGREWLVDQFAARDLRVSHFEVQERGAATLDGDRTARGQTGERDAEPDRGGSRRSGDRADNALQAPRDGARPVGWSPRAGRRIDLRI